jgi:hypothetical protein
MAGQLALTDSQLTLQAGELPVSRDGAPDRTGLACGDQSLNRSLLQKIVARQPDSQRCCSASGSAHAGQNFQDQSRRASGFKPDFGSFRTGRGQLSPISPAHSLGGGLLLARSRAVGVDRRS